MYSAALLLQNEALHRRRLAGPSAAFPRAPANVFMRNVATVSLVLVDQLRIRTGICAGRRCLTREFSPLAAKGMTQRHWEQRNVHVTRRDLDACMLPPFHQWYGMHGQ